MKKTFVTLTVGALFIAGIAASHPGATGVVRERMDGMMAMRDAVRTLSPMMQGQTDYDRQSVIDAAAAIEMHAGATMLAQFPEGSGGNPSVARPEIWQDWEAFEALAMRMEVVAGALGAAANNPPGSAMPGQTGSSGMMGSSAMMGGNGAPDAEMLAQMPVDRVFTVAAQVCSACHTRFRAERD